MRIIIAGDGDTGHYLARQLSRENFDIILLGKDADRLADYDLRYNILTMEGSATSPEALRRAGTSGCDMFVAVTPSENANLIACQIAKSMEASKTVARIDTREYIKPGNKEIFTTRGIDTLVYPEFLAAKEIASVLDNPWLMKIYNMHHGEVSLVVVQVPKDSEIDGMRLSDFASIGRNFHVSAIRRASKTIIPRGSDVIQAGDIVYFTFARGSGADERIMTLCGKKKKKVNRVLISGGGKITRLLLERISGERKVTVVEPDREICKRLAESFPSATIVNGDYRDLETLREEGLECADAFIALTDSSERNIVSCMVARDNHVPVTIAEIEDFQYFSEATSLNIGSVINKKLLTSGMIYGMLLDSMMLQAPSFVDLEEGEVVEILVGEGAKVTKAPVKDLSLPSGMTIGALIRDGVGMLVDGNTQILASDHVVVFYVGGYLSRIEKYFK